jgi:Kdo2-lipid IVA lauroyltransferase/acyltransferase
MRSQILHFLSYLLTTILAAGLRLLPRKWRSRCGAWLGRVLYFVGIRKKVTINNLISAFPELPPRAAEEVGGRCYEHFGRFAAAFAALPNLRPEAVGDWIFIEGLDQLEAAVARGTGGIVVSGHLGHWELMGAIVARLGLPVSFVVTTQRNKRIERMMDDYRRMSGIEIIKRREAVRGVISALRRNRLVALLIDQDAHEDGAFVPFFGRLASTPRGPAVFQLRTGAPLIFAQSVRLPGERYRIRLTGVDTMGIDDADVLTAKLTAQLEAAIRETPEQWTWMHKRWKSSPPASS